MTSSTPLKGATLAVGLALTLAHSSSAQVTHGGEPAGLRAPFPKPAPVVDVPAPDVEAYLAEDEARGHRPLRYGALVELDVTTEDGEWSTLPDGSRAWRLRITSEGAFSLALEFDAFYLPAGAQMFVYREGAEGFLGSYTSENKHLDGGFVFEPFDGSDMTLEIDVPEGADDPVIDTKALIYDYRDVNGLMDGSVVTPGSGGEEGACLIDVNCPQGDNWEVQKRATVRTLSGGGLCSGALINNTAFDGTAYVLTANHCGQGSNTVFRFKYQRANCGAGNAPTNMSVSGNSVLASNGQYDNRLLRINSNIPDNYDPYFAGWSRGIGQPNFAFAMGHPSGGPKKISIDSNGAIRESEFWRVAWSEGLLEGGSSGGPLFDQNGRVRGPACCVSNFVCGSQTSWFGRFDRFFNVSNLDQWLDPLNTGQTLLNGFDPICPTPATYCTTAPNSAGSGALIGSVGSSIFSANNLTLVFSGAVPGQPGIFYFGPDQIQTPFGDGFRCVGGQTTRLGPVTADAFGGGAMPLDLDNLPPGGVINAGDTVNFQYWYRDPAGNAGFNLSDGLTATFCP